MPAKKLRNEMCNKLMSPQSYMFIDKCVKTTVPRCCSKHAPDARKNLWNTVWCSTSSSSLSLVLKQATSCISACTLSHSQLHFTAWWSNLKWLIHSLPVHPGDLIANNHTTSPIIKWCTKDLSFRLSGSLCTHLGSQLPSSSLTK